MHPFRCGAYIHDSRRDEKDSTLRLPCDSAGIQTLDLQNRNLTLYSAKLRSQKHPALLPSECKGKKYLLTDQIFQAFRFYHPFKIRPNSDLRQDLRIKCCHFVENEAEKTRKSGSEMVDGWGTDGEEPSTPCIGRLVCQVAGGYPCSGICSTANLPGYLPS